jgi:hypothetical protein
MPVSQVRPVLSLVEIQVVGSGYSVQHLEANVMSVPGVVAPGVAQPNNHPTNGRRTVGCFAPAKQAKR